MQLYEQAAVSGERLDQVQHELGDAMALTRYQATAPGLGRQPDEHFYQARGMCSASRERLFEHPFVTGSSLQHPLVGRMVTSWQISAATNTCSAP